MKKSIMSAVAASLLIAAAGCSSVEVAPASKLSGVALSDNGRTIAHVNASYGGWYFLWLPILTGAKNPKNGIAFACDTCNVTSAVDTLTEQAKLLGGSKVVNLTSTQDSSIFLPIPLLFRWKTTTVSGNVIR